MIAAILLAMITTAGEYFHADNAWDFTIDRNIMPLRTNKNILRGVDMAFLTEAFILRRMACGVDFNNCWLSVPHAPNAQFANKLGAAFKPGGLFQQNAIPIRYGVPQVTILNSEDPQDITMDCAGFRKLLQYRLGTNTVDLVFVPDVTTILTTNFVAAVFENERRLQRFICPTTLAGIGLSYILGNSYRYSRTDTTASGGAYELWNRKPVHRGLPTQRETRDTTHPSNAFMVFHNYETSSYYGGYNVQPGGDFIRNEWYTTISEYTRPDSAAYSFAYYRPQMPVGSTFRIISAFTYYQFARKTDGDGTHETTRRGFIVGNETTNFGKYEYYRTCSQYTAFPEDAVRSIRNQCRLIDPQMNGYMIANNYPDWYDMNDVTPQQYINLQDWRRYTREYSEYLQAVPIGFLVDVGERTKWSN